MRAPISFLWTLLLVAGVVLLHSGSVRSTQATPCEAAEAWEAYGGGGGYTNSTGNLTDIGYNRTAGGTSGQGGMNHTTSRNATVPMPNGTAVPRATKNPQASTADFPFTAKTTAATLTIVILLLAA